MMNYAFPHIHHIDDVLEHIQEYPEFIVSDKDDYIVVNYVVTGDNTFKIDVDNPLSGMIRRECRGIIFYKDGRIMSRPFHKFFNIGEKPETQPQNIDLSQNHCIQHKLDGSMIRPIDLNGGIRWSTKMGITDVSMKAEVYVAHNSKYQKFAEFCFKNNLTPIFEYTAPDNKIVIEYEKPELSLLAVRHTITGEYLNVY